MICRQDAAHHNYAGFAARCPPLYNLLARNGEPAIDERLRFPPAISLHVVYSGESLQIAMALWNCEQSYAMPCFQNAGGIYSIFI